jgi:hypothetical protein
LDGVIFEFKGSADFKSRVASRFVGRQLDLP